MTKFKAVLFDLDGTLVDSVPDIHAALNETLASYGEPPFTVDEVAKMVGRGLPVTIERAWAKLDKTLDPASRDKIVARFRAIYTPRATELTTLNAGASDTTRRLAAEGIKLGVVTNKPLAETRIILDHFGLSDLMDVVLGGDEGEKKPAPDLLLMACERLSTGVEETLFVGDSEYDVGAARAAGMTVLALAGGYTGHSPEALGADAVIQRLDEVSAFIGLSAG